MKKGLYILTLVPLISCTREAKQSGVVQPERPPAEKRENAVRDTVEQRPDWRRQLNPLTDRELEAQIRREIDNSKIISDFSKKVKVRAEGGVVTLEGAVANEREHKAVVDTAKALSDNVKENLKVENRPGVPGY